MPKFQLFRGTTPILVECEQDLKWVEKISVLQNVLLLLNTDKQLFFGIYDATESNADIPLATQMHFLRDNVTDIANNGKQLAFIVDTGGLIYQCNSVPENEWTQITLLDIIGASRVRFINFWSAGLMITTQDNSIYWVGIREGIVDFLTPAKLCISSLANSQRVLQVVGGVDFFAVLFEPIPLSSNKSMSSNADNGFDEFYRKGDLVSQRTVAILNGNKDSEVVYSPTNYCITKMATNGFILFALTIYGHVYHYHTINGLFTLSSNGDHIRDICVGSSDEACMVYAANEIKLIVSRYLEGLKLELAPDEDTHLSETNENGYRQKQIMGADGDIYYFNKPKALETRIVDYVNAFQKFIAIEQDAVINEIAFNKKILNQRLDSHTILPIVLACIIRMNEVIDGKCCICEMLEICYADDIIENYRNYLIDDYEKLCRTKRSVDKSIPKFNNRLNIVQMVIQTIEDLVENHKCSLSTVVQLRKAINKWKALFATQNQALEIVKRTEMFWHTTGLNLIGELQKNGRRFLTESRAYGLKLTTSGLFVSHNFIIFNDMLCHQYSDQFELYPIGLVWAWLTVSAGNMVTIKIVTPDKQFILDGPLRAREWWDMYRTIFFDENETRFGRYVFSERHINYPNAMYIGEWLSGQMHGTGQLEFIDGRVYTGEMNANNIEGFGRLCTPGISVYEGAFRLGKRCGYGKLEMSNDRSLYSGYFQNDMYHGHGKLLSNEFTYIGGFERHQRNGYGIMESNNDGNKYLGLFVNDQQSSTGIYVTSSGNYFEGLFVDDKRMSKGVALFGNGNIYKGELTLDGPCGDGTFYINSQCNGEIIDRAAHPSVGSSFITVKGKLDGKWKNLKLTNATMQFTETPVLPKHTEIYTTDNNLKWKSLIDCWHRQLVECSIRQADFRTKIANFQRRLQCDSKIRSQMLAGPVRDPAGGAHSKFEDILYKQKLSAFDQYELDVSIIEKATVVKSDEEPESIDFGQCGDLDVESIRKIESYLQKAFKSLDHPFGMLIDIILDCFYSCYGCWKYRAVIHLADQAMAEWESIVRRLYAIVRDLFPALPESSAICDGVYISYRRLLYPILLNEGFYSSLFVLFATKCSHNDELYRQKLLDAEHKSDQQLAEIINIEIPFYQLIQDELFKAAIVRFREFKSKYNPNEMIEEIKVIYDTIRSTMKAIDSKIILNGDRFLPITIFVILRAKIPHLGAELTILSCMIESDYDIVRGETEYYLTTLKAAYQHIISA